MIWALRWDIGGFPGSSPERRLKQMSFEARSRYGHGGIEPEAVPSSLRFQVYRLIPTLGPEVCKWDLLRAIRSAGVWLVADVGFVYHVATRKAKDYIRTSEHPLGAAPK